MVLNYTSLVSVDLCFSFSRFSVIWVSFSMYCQFIDFAHLFVVGVFFFSYRLSSIHYTFYILKKNCPFYISPVTFVFDVLCHMSFKVKLVSIPFLYCLLVCVIP